MPKRVSSKSKPVPRLRLGLCCQFAREPIKFRTTTARAMMRLPRGDQLASLARLCLLNAEALASSLDYCSRSGIGGFRINSQILPLKTHPEIGYDIAELPESGKIIARFKTCGDLARAQQIRLTFHPDQFVVLNSPNPVTLRHSVAELIYQAEVADWVGADTLNIHGGGAYGDKVSALRSLRENVERLPEAVRSRLTLENDDRVFTPVDLLPVCLDLELPLVYDVHHHRCLPDGLSVERASEQACQTWNREPLFHISSPLGGWSGSTPQRHHDYINPRDFPACWKPLRLTVEVEAKAKELAVLKLLRALAENGNPDARSVSSAG